MSSSSAITGGANVSVPLTLTSSVRLSVSSSGSVLQLTGGGSFDVTTTTSVASGGTLDLNEPELGERHDVGQRRVGDGVGRDVGGECDGPGVNYSGAGVSIVVSAGTLSLLTSATISVAVTVSGTGSVTQSAARSGSDSSASAIGGGIDQHGARNRQSPPKPRGTPRSLGCARSTRPAPSRRRS